MAETAAGIMVDTLLHWGVEVVFGLPGDGITLDQSKKFTESLIRGTPHRGQIALTVLSDKIKELI